MSWTRPADLRAQVERLWARGALLSVLAEGAREAEAYGEAAPALSFPRRLTLKGPTSSELVDRFDEVRRWIAELLQGRHYRVALREVRHPVLGTNVVPDQVWVDTLEDALTLIGKTRDARRFSALVAVTRERQPALLPWLARYPIRALQYAEEWPLFLDVVAWLRRRPRPGIYLRQMDLPGIHTKFIEKHRAVLAELLDLALPPAAIDAEATGVARFCRRFGFQDKPARIRFRILDPRHAVLPPVLDQDLEITDTAFARLDIGVRRVFITENEVNFLAFPTLPDAMVVFGGGYGFEMLAEAAWLQRCAVHYWGDIDTHGFAILDQLRARLPHVESFLMDRGTLIAHRAQWGDEPRPLDRELHRLQAAERELFEELRNGTVQAGVRLEQERIDFGWVERALKRLQAVAVAS